MTPSEKNAYQQVIAFKGVFSVAEEAVFVTRVIIWNPLHKAAHGKIAEVRQDSVCFQGVVVCG